MTGKVQDIMSRRLISVTPDDTVKRIQEIFDSHNIHHVLVVEDRQIMGIISDRDILRNISPYVGSLAATSHDTQTLTRRAHQVMTRHPKTITGDVEITAAAQILLDSTFTCLPVVNDQDRPVGIITWHDIMRSLLRQVSQ